MTFSHYNHHRFEVQNCNILENEGDILEFESQIKHQVETGYDEHLMNLKIYWIKLPIKYIYDN